MKKFISNKYVLTIFGCILFLLLWLLISAIINDTTMIFPDPLKTFKETWRILTKGKFIYVCIGWTMYRMLIGFVVSFALAMIFGILAGNFKSLRYIFQPIIVALKSIPTAALVFLFLVITNAKYAPIYIVILISFPILYEAITAGIANISEELLEAAKVDGSKFLRTTFKIRLPLALPYIFVGIASSFALSFKIEIMAEIITGYTKDGLGSAILFAQRNDPSNMVPIFAYSLIAIIFILLITVLEDVVKRLFQKRY